MQYNLPEMKLNLIYLLSFAILAISPNCHAEEIEFELNSNLSSVDLTAFGYRNYAFIATTTRDTQTMPLGGTITLDVDISNDTVLSVDFVSLDFDYVVDPVNPTIHTHTTLYDSIEEIPKGTEIEIHLPFNEALAAGNPASRYAPRLSLGNSGAGTETGAGGELLLMGSDFQFEGTGQYFNLPSGRDSVFVDGWPMDYGPYPSSTPFPSMIPGTEYIPGVSPNTTMSPAPAGPNSLDGTVTIVNGNLVFEATLFSKGVGGDGILQSAQIHEGTIYASTASAMPGDFNNDGDADGKDFILWQRNPTIGELSDWRSNYGNTAVSAFMSIQQVPEPTSLTLLAFGMLLANSRRRL